MYSVEYIDTDNRCCSKLRFNSVLAIHKFMKEKLVNKDIEAYTEHLRNRKKLDALNFAQSENQLYPLYGDIDKGLPSLSQIQAAVYNDGYYDYRIGTNNPMFYEGFRRISFSVKYVSQGIQADKPSKLNNIHIQPTQVLANEYSRPHHE